jgi:hypothetical protein
VEVDLTITCVDCGEPARLLSYPPEDGVWHPGDLVTYRCTGCGDRWDLVVPDDDPMDDDSVD